METTLLPGQVCVAVEKFEATEKGDLKFDQGDKLTIVRDSEMKFWYLAQNNKGEVGTVPGNYLEPISPPPLPMKKNKYSGRGKPRSNNNSVSSSSPLPPPLFDEYYEHMKPGQAVAPSLPPKPMQPISEEKRHMLSLMEREKKTRLAKGTLVVATATYRSNTPGDLSFKLHEEMMIIEPLKDLCWYKAHKADSRNHVGSIPLTHVRLVYMSDEENEESLYRVPKRPGHERMYEDKNDFITNSGWFSHGGMPLGKEAQYHCLARKAELDHAQFMSINEAVYMLQYMNEKTFIGKARVLHEGLANHFECFGKRLRDIRDIDDELCHHTTSAGWKIKVWPLKEGQVLDVEHAKKVVEYDALISPDGGLTDKMSFSSLDNFENFWQWLSPN